MSELPRDPTEPAGKLDYVLLEFEYQSTVRPSDLFESDDRRELAVGFVEITAVSIATGEQIGLFDFRASHPENARVIYGICPPEPWGSWSLGTRSALLLKLHVPTEGIVLHIRHQIVIGGLALTPARLTLNRQTVRELVFAGGVATVEIAQPIDWGRLHSANNVSLVADAKPELSIVIINYNRPDLLLMAVSAALSAGIAAPFEIISVDNGSDDQCRSTLAAWNLPMRLLALSDRRSFGSANNIAVEAARGDHILLLNNDAFLAEGAVDLLRAALAESDAGAVGPTFLYPGGALQELGAFVNADGQTCAPLNNCAFQDIPDITRVDYISAACLMMARGDFLKIGGFDPVYGPAYYEDVDLCLRLLAAGKPTRLVKNAAVRHIKDATSGAPDMLPTTLRWFCRNRETFRSRWGRWLASRAEVSFPAVPSFDLATLDQQVAAFPDQTINCALVFEELRPSPDSHSAIAAAAVLNLARPTMLATPTRYAVTDICNLAWQFGLPYDRLTAGDEAALRGRDIETVVVSGRNFPVAAPPYGRWRILHCPFPAPLRDGSVEGLIGQLGGLLNYDAIVTDSEFGRDACLRTLSQLGAASIPIMVIRPPSEAFAAADLSSKDDLVISIGPLRRDAGGGGHEDVLRAFRAFQSRHQRGGWRLVIAGDISPDDDPGYIDRLREVMQSPDLHLMVNPSRAQLRDLFVRAKVYVSAVGLGTSFPDQAWACAHSGAEAGSAIAAGCVAVVYKIGAGAEICDLLGAGYRFESVEELPQTLADAAVQAEPGGSRIADPERIEMLCEAAYRGAWERLLSGIAERAPQPPAANGAGTTNLRPALVVLGMHRSGTSAMTRVLSLAGAELPSRLMPPAPDNRTGFWEPADIADFNSDVLTALGSRWDDIFAFDLDPLLTTGPKLIDTACDRLRSNYSGIRPIVLKDPRISILTDLWRQALAREQYEAGFVVMVRDPREVAQSLTTRNGFPRWVGLLLWAGYMIAAERNTRGAPRIFVSYRDLLTDPGPVLERIQARLDLALPRPIQGEIEARQFLDPLLRHHRFDGNFDFGPYARLKDLYECLTAEPADIARIESTAADVRAWLLQVREAVGAMQPGASFAAAERPGIGLV